MLFLWEMQKSKLFYLKLYKILTTHFQNVHKSGYSLENRVKFSQLYGPLAFLDFDLVYKKLTRRAPGIFYIVIQKWNATIVRRFLLGKIIYHDM